MASNHREFAEGDIVAGMQGWQAFALSDGIDIAHKVDPAVAPISTALGVLGHTGLTAYFTLLDVARPEATDTVVVSTAAGAIGSVGGAIADSVLMRITVGARIVVCGTAVTAS